jgi:BirA family biotin operon repressor/biotin-[acetyl-CoA-carboxylase] ligase
MKQMPFFSNSNDRIDLAVCNQALIGTRFAGKLQHFASVPSTNTLLLEAAMAGAPEGTVYIADEQTAGRGRGGHAWHSAPASLHCTCATLFCFLSPQVSPPGRPSMQSQLLVSISVGPMIFLQAKESLVGILVETAVEPGDDPQLRYAVIGIGINLHNSQFPPELRDIATSLALESKLPVFTEPLLMELLRQLDIELARLERGAFFDGSNLVQRFTEFSTWANGKRVHVPEQGGYTGRTAGLDERGFLLVDCDDGTRRTVLSGGVREAE